MQAWIVKVRPLSAWMDKSVATQRWQKILLAAIAILRVWCQTDIPVSLNCIKNWRIMGIYLAAKNVSGIVPQPSNCLFQVHLLFILKLLLCCVVGCHDIGIDMHSSVSSWWNGLKKKSLFCARNLFFQSSQAWWLAGCWVCPKATDPGHAGSLVFRCLSCRFSGRSSRASINLWQCGESPIHIYLEWLPRDTVPGRCLWKECFGPLDCCCGQQSY